MNTADSWWKNSGPKDLSSTPPPVPPVPPAPLVPAASPASAVPPASTASTLPPTAPASHPRALHATLPAAPPAPVPRRPVPHIAEMSPPPAPSRGGAAAADTASIGDTINRAIGEYDARIARLKDELDEKKREIKTIERDIARIEKEQAKAFKDLLGANPQIKKILGTAKAAKGRGTGKARASDSRRAKGKTTRRAAKVAPAPDAADGDESPFA